MRLKNVVISETALALVIVVDDEKMFVIETVDLSKEKSKLKLESQVLVKSVVSLRELNFFFFLSLNFF